MAKDKKSFVAYCDWLESFEELSDEEAGKLVKHLFRYVSDLNPKAPDKLTKMMFIPIKQALKRDLKKYEGYIQKQVENGKKGGRPKKPTKPKKPKPFSENPTEPKKADNVNDSVNDSVNELSNDNSKQFQFFPNEKLNNVFGKWLKMLAEKGKPMSPSSIEALQMKLNMQNVEYSIKQVQQSLENSWMTLQSVDDATKNNIGEPVNKISLNEVLVDINRSKYFDNEDFDYLFKKYLKMLAGQNLWIDEDGVKRMIARIKKMTILDASKKIQKYTRDRIFYENIDITTGKKTEFEEFKYHKDIIPL